MPKVLLAMSGGVDSSVAAALLQRRGFDVVGVFMRLGSPGEALDQISPIDTAACDMSAATKPLKIGHQGCCSINDAGDARLVAARLNVPFYVVNFKKDFGRIIGYFEDEYARGRTPNPCVRCNDWLKFGKLHDYAAQLGCDFVASGHYARIVASDDGPRLARGVDGSKDQSYVLFGIPRDQLAGTLFPIGDMEKPAVREVARKLDLPVFDKPDSQEICFVPDNDYAGLLERRNVSLTREGQVVDTAGNVLGTHQGQHRFTIGQRRGLSVAVGRPLYVVSKNASDNSVVVGSREDLLVRSCFAADANWLVRPPPIGDEVRCLAQYRYNSDQVPVAVRALPDAAAPGHSGRVARFECVFDTPQEAVAPGQALVLYDEESRVIGGGWIEATRRASVAESE
jgi:tRNA-specific 2-thiouridylase